MTIKKLDDVFFMQIVGMEPLRLNKETKSKLNPIYVRDVEKNVSDIGGAGGRMLVTEIHIVEFPKLVKVMLEDNCLPVLQKATFRTGTEINVVFGGTQHFENGIKIPVTPTKNLISYDDALHRMKCNASSKK